MRDCTVTAGLPMRANNNTMRVNVNTITMRAAGGNPDRRHRHVNNITKNMFMRIPGSGVAIDVHPLILGTLAVAARGT